MNRKISSFSSNSLIALLTLTVSLATTDFALGEGATTHPWPSFRHDLLNIAAAPDSGYPTTKTCLWSKNRSDRPDAPIDWCYNDPIELLSNTGKCYVENMDDCPPWCFECTTEKHDCSEISLVICLDMDNGETKWERTPFKDPGGPNVGRPWYDQKFSWHLSPPLHY